MKTVVKIGNKTPFEVYEIFTSRQDHKQKVGTIKKISLMQINKIFCVPNLETNT